MQKLSVALAVYNEEKNLEKCLNAVVGCAAEIVIVDGGSTDATLMIAEKYPVKIIRADNPPIFHLNKQKALEACRGDWILQLDADEVVSESLKQEIQQVISNSPDIAGYNLPRKNYFLGHWLKKGGQYPDYVIRLFKNGKGRFPCQSVHEQIIVDGEIAYLTNPLDHYSYYSIDEYWKKASLYIKLTAQSFRKSKIKKNLSSVLSYFVFKPVGTFWLIFVRHKGFFDGVYGFLFALFSALHHPLAFWQYIYPSTSPALPDDTGFRTLP